jgi:hypothetical protein
MREWAASLESAKIMGSGIRPVVTAVAVRLVVAVAAVKFMEAVVARVVVAGVVVAGVVVALVGLGRLLVADSSGRVSPSLSQ